MTSCCSLRPRSRITARELGIKHTHPWPQQTAGGHAATGIANMHHIDVMPVARATEEQCAGRNIGWHSIAHWVAHTVVASTRRATRTCYSHCRVNETRTEPLVMHLRAMRDKCLIKRIRRVVCFLLIRGEGSQHHTPPAEQQ